MVLFYGAGVTRQGTGLKVSFIGSTSKSVGFPGSSA